MSERTLSEPTPQKKGSLHVSAFFCPSTVDPFDTVKWEKRTAEIKDDSGKVIFEQTDCDFPVSWSEIATNVVASKYFYGENGKCDRENSVRQLIHRVSRTIADWGAEDGYFADEASTESFYRELTWLLLHQHGSFNSPVWFNVGLRHVYGIRGPANNWRWDEASQDAVPVEDSYEYPQGSACFIQSVSDDMTSIMSLATSEAMLFKYGSGTGTDLSTLRSTREKLSGGGKPSGPVSFMRVYDSIAGVIKSGGKTRRAAKMQTLKVWHPDIMEFIECKVKEERKALSLIAQGYESNFNGEAYGSVCFQNANLSVRVTDEFMHQVEKDGFLETKSVTSGETIDRLSARIVLNKIAECAWHCGDPGLQYENKIQEWHTCSNTAPINSSNPCSEFMFLDDTACNLASLNLRKFADEFGSFDIERFRSACRIFIIAQDILVDRASYPTQRIAKNSHIYRPLGLGYANLGSLLMLRGTPYDSEEGRTFAAGVTAIMHGEAYLTSSVLAGVLGPFEGYEKNAEPMYEVMQKHALYAASIPNTCPQDLRQTAQAVWEDVLEHGALHGYRNSQVTVLAPTGTIAFMMDCDTTGIEPDIALVKYKSLAGGGSLKIVNRTVPAALKNLGYDDAQIRAIVEHIEKHDSIENAPGLKIEDLPVFDCAFPPAKGGRSIHHMGHVRMMAEVQPFLSGAISKTVNMSQDATVEDIVNVYSEGWRLGLKAIAVYRDGSKGSQPLNTSSCERESADEPAETSAVTTATPVPRRWTLPDTRSSVTHKFNVQGHKGYITVGFFENGQPGELFVTMAKEGSTIGGLMDTIGASVSLGLQHGVPLDVFVRKFTHTRFEPAGFTGNPDIPIAKSIVDYIFRWLGIQFIDGYRASSIPDSAGHAGDEYAKRKTNTEEMSVSQQTQFAAFQSDAPSCDICGSLTVRCGACYRCFNCGNSLGCS